ncbi:MAG: SMI1/KNR4 family protein [Minicystis sp.]
MAKDSARPLVFVFPLPPDVEKALPPALAGTLGYYHDRPLMGQVERAIGAEPALDEATRRAVFDAVEARIEALGLEERLYRGSTSKHRVDIRGFVTGPTVDEVRAACERAGWTLVLPLDEPEGAAAPAEAKPAPKTKRAKAAAPPAIPKAISAQIARIEVLAKKAGRSLAGGASFDSILALEEKIGVALPIEVRAFYLAHDGGPDAEPLFGDRRLLSLEGIATSWEMWEDSDEEDLDEEVDAARGVRREWWNPKWIPVSHDAGGNHEMVDLAPAKGGKAGQIVSVYHDDGGRSLEGPDFLTWLEAKLGATKAGSAKKTAESAKKTAGSAKKTAEAAKKTAGAAKKTAGAAKKTAGAAKKTAAATKKPARAGR